MSSVLEDKHCLASEQIVQIVAVACEQPASSGRPISHWTPRELALLGGKTRPKCKRFPLGSILDKLVKPHA